MKSIIFIIIGVMFCNLPIKSQWFMFYRKNFYKQGNERLSWSKKYRYGKYKYYYDNGMHKGYWVDRIPFDSINYCVIRNEELHKSYYLPKEYFSSPRVIDEKDLLSRGYGIFAWRFVYDPQSQNYIKYNSTETEITERKEIRIPKVIKRESIGIRNIAWDLVTFEKNPSYLDVYLFRGSLWNSLCISSAGYYERYKFPERGRIPIIGYYKVFVPVYEY